MTVSPRSATIDRFAFFSSRMLSQAGQSLFLAALLLITGASDHGALNLSGVFAAMLAAAVLFGLPGGALADRFGPARGYAFGAAGRLAFIGLALAVVREPQYAWVAAFGYSAVSQVFSPAEMALVPVIQRGCPARAHTLLVILQYAGQGLGMLVLAPALLLLAGERALLAGAAALYLPLVATTLLLAVRLGRTGRLPRTPRRARLRDTLRFFATEPRAAYATGVLTFTEVAWKAVFIAAPLFLARDLDLSQREAGFLAVMGGLGVLIGLGWTGRGFGAEAAPRVMRLTMVGMVGACLGLVLLGRGLTELAALSQVELLMAAGESSRTALVIAAPLTVILGLSLAVAPIGARAVLTATAPHGGQARVFAAQATFSHTVVILPLMAIGAGTQIAGAGATVGAVGAAGLGLLLALEQWRARTAAGAAPDTILPVPVPAEVALSGD